VTGPADNAALGGSVIPNDHTQCALIRYYTYYEVSFQNLPKSTPACITSGETPSMIQKVTPPTLGASKPHRATSFAMQWQQTSWSWSLRFPLRLAPTWQFATYLRSVRHFQPCSTRTQRLCRTISMILKPLQNLYSDPLHLPAMKMPNILILPAVLRTPCEIATAAS